MKTLTLLSVITAISATALAGAQTQTLLKAKLTGIGKSTVTYQTQDQIDEHEAELEAEGYKLPKGVKLYLVVGSNPEFSLSTNARGYYDLYRHYLGFPRPTINDGDTAYLVDASGKVYESGVFHKVQVEP